MNRKTIFEEAFFEQATFNTRRHFLKQCTSGLGGIALSSILGGCFNSDQKSVEENPFAVKPPHFTAKAKHIIFLHMEGAPSQLELFDYKPELAKLDGQLCPPSLLEGKRFAFIKGTPKMLSTMEMHTLPTQDCHT